LTTVSKLGEPVRKRRGDAERNVERILDAAVDLLGQGGSPSIGEVARAAGVARQTVYAHFPHREALMAAVVDLLSRTTTEVLASLDLREGGALAALDRWVAAAWDVIDRYPALLNPDLAAAAGPDADHAPIVASLRPLLRRGQRAGEITRELEVDWLVDAVIALGHLAGQQVSSGQRTPAEAGAAFRASARRLCSAGPRSR